MSVFRGEYWLQGDYVESVVESNHEGVAQERARRQLLESLGIDPQQDFICDDELNKGIEEALEEPGPWTDFLEDEMHQTAAEIWMEANHPEDLHCVKAAFGFGDLREWAMKHHGWMAMRSNQICTWKLGPEQMQNIKRCVEEILDFDCRDEAEIADCVLILHIGETGNRAEIALQSVLDGEFQLAQAAYTYDHPKECAAVRQLDRAIETPYYQGKAA